MSQTLSAIYFFEIASLCSVIIVAAGVNWFTDGTVWKSITVLITVQTLVLSLLLKYYDQVLLSMMAPLLCYCYVILTAVVSFLSTEADDVPQTQDDVSDSTQEHLPVTTPKQEPYVRLVYDTEKDNENE